MDHNGALPKLEVLVTNGMTGVVLGRSTEAGVAYSVLVLL